jgi:hypothetical protein
MFHTAAFLTTGAAGLAPVLWARSSSAVALSRPHMRQAPRARPQRRARTCAQLAMPGASAVALRDDDEARDAFAKAVKGEWTGFEAEFDADTGVPQIVPNYYIPDDFVEWGMQPVGFESVHSVVLRGMALYHKHFRILPCVSHFGDHVDLEENLTLYQVAEDLGFLAFPNGSFSAGDAKVVTDRTSILDKTPATYLVLRHNGAAVHADVKFDFAKCELTDAVRIVKERYTCIHCDGADIDGSSGYVEGWCSDPASHPEDLAGIWHSSADGSSVERPDGGPPRKARKQLYLPHGIDVSLTTTADNGVDVRLGWLVEPSHRLVLTRSYRSDGVVNTSTLFMESKVV